MTVHACWFVQQVTSNLIVVPVRPGVQGAGVHPDPGRCGQSHRPAASRRILQTADLRPALFGRQQDPPQRLQLPDPQHHRPPRNLLLPSPSSTPSGRKAATCTSRSTSAPSTTWTRSTSRCTSPEPRRWRWTVDTEWFHLTKGADGVWQGQVKGPRALQGQGPESLAQRQLRAR